MATFRLQIINLSCRTNRIHFSNTIFYRRYSSDCTPIKKGLVLGVYLGCEPEEYRLTYTAQRFDEERAGRISALLKGSGLKVGQAIVFSNMGSEYYEVAVSCLGRPVRGFRESQGLDEARENVRIAAGAGAKALQDRGMTHIEVEPFTSAEAAAEGSTLSVWKYQELKARENHVIIPCVDLICTETNEDIREEWRRGFIKGECQNIARKLEETPANLMTPAIFAQQAIETLCPIGIEVEVKGRDWLSAMGMMSFLNVARGSCEPPLFVHISYCGADLDVKPIILIGKGVTFDTGSMNLKPCENMSEYRGDMAGGAVVLGTIKAIAQMQLPINVKGLIPLCENSFGGTSMKPGDVVVAWNGKTIRMENTDNEGRVVVADALSYSSVLKPCLVINVADVTSALKMGVGEPASGVFSTSDEVWQEMKHAGADTGDRFWRFPLWEFYRHKVTDYLGVDVNNVGKGTGGEPCVGAAFLMEFAPPVDFVHVDISGTGMTSSGLTFPYLKKGLMSGRPVRSLAQLLYRMGCPHYRVDTGPLTENPHLYREIS